MAKYTLKRKSFSANTQLMKKVAEEVNFKELGPENEKLAAKVKRVAGNITRPAVTWARKNPKTAVAAGITGVGAGAGTVYAVKRSKKEEKKFSNSSMIIPRQRVFNEIENAENILKNLESKGIGPGNKRYDTVAENLKNRQTINNSSKPVNTVVNNTTKPANNLPATISKTNNLPAKVPNNTAAKGFKIGKWGKAGLIGAGVLGAGMMAKGFFGGKKDKAS